MLRDYAIRGYVLDQERLKNGAFLSQEYYENLLAEIREIRASERKFYQKITDIYSTAMDYSPAAEATQAFFATVQNKLHFAIHGRTAAELIEARADSQQERKGQAGRSRCLAPFRKKMLVDYVRVYEKLTPSENQMEPSRHESGASLPTKGRIIDRLCSTTGFIWTIGANVS